MHLKVSQKLLALIVINQLASPVIAQDGSKNVDPVSDEQAGKAMLSLTQVEPDLTPFSDYSGEFFNRATLTGDWGGSRTNLYEQGVTFDALLTQVYQNVASGGVDSGNDDTYTGLLDYGMTFDTGKLGLWSGGLLTFNAQTGFASNDPLGSGNLSPTNFTGIYPTADKPDTVLMEYYLTQALSKELGVVVGRINAVNFLDKNRYADNPRNQFMNLAMNNSPLLGSMVSFSTYAVLASWQVSENITINPAIYDPNLQPGDSSPKGKGLFSDVGYGVEVAVSWKLSDEYDGALRVDGLYNNKDTTLLDNPRLPEDILLGISPETKSSNWLVNVNFEQAVWKPAGAGTKNTRRKTQALPQLRTSAYDFEEPGIGVFGRVAYGPDDRHAWDFYVMGGVSGRGIFEGRPYDRIGVGFYHMKEGDDLNDQPGNLLQDETGYEVFYNLAITPSVQLTFDVQWVDSGITGNDDATVVGMRLMTPF